MLPLYSTATVRRTPVVTSLLVLANVLAFGWQVAIAVGSGAEPLQAFMTAHGLVPARLVAGYAREDQWWTLLTHMFLHGGIAHLVGNLWFLWVFGRSVEDRIGPVGFLLLYAAAGTAAAGLQVVVDSASTLPMIGASGAISGVLGAYLVMMPDSWILALVPWIVPILPVPAFIFLALWFLLQMYNGVGSLLGSPGEGGVAWWAHAGGFVAGVGLLSLVGRPRRRK